MIYIYKIINALNGKFCTGLGHEVSNNESSDIAKGIGSQREECPGT